MEIRQLEGFKDFLTEKYAIEIVDIIPVKNVMRIVTTNGDKCLKRTKYKKEQFLFIFSAMQHLVNHGFDSIIPFIPTMTGELFVDLGNSFGYLTDWISSRECNYSNPIELKMATVAMANLHRCSINYIPPEGSEPRVGWGRWIEKFSSRVDDMIHFMDIIMGKDKLSYFDNIYRENLPYFINQGISAIENLKKTRYFELSLTESKNHSFCHHDFANHNVLISDDLKAYIIDFDYCICDTRLHDLSSLIIRNMRHGNWNMEKAQFIIDCYQKIGTVEKDEIPVMNGFMEFPQDFWQVGLQYYIEKQKWEEDNFNKRLDRAVNDKNDRQLFIDEFKYSIEI